MSGVSGTIQKIGAKVLVVIVRREADGRVALLCDHFEDAEKGIKFYRLPGGGIEFGETSREALVREVREELGCGAQICHFFGWKENHFVYNGEQSHQLVAVYAAEVLDASVYTRDEVEILDLPGRTQIWVPYAELCSGDVPFYPAGIADMIGAWVVARQREMEIMGELANV